jgi:hypothetical protein
MAVTPTTLRTSITAGTTGRLAEVNTLHGAVNELTKAVSGTAMNLRAQAGVVGDGTTDDAAAINSAATAAASLGVMMYAAGTFKIATGVTLNCECDLSAATFSYSGTSGTAVTVGLTGSYQMRRQVRLPKIIATAKTITGWTQVAGTVGLLVQNCYNVDLTIPHVQSFESGLKVYGTTSNGVSYCNITLGHLDNNKRNLWMTADATGWANQNSFFGGRLSHDSGEGTAVSGTRHVLIDTTASKVNGNSFYGTSIESPNVVEYHIDCGGNDNYWFGCRLENTGTGARVVWRANSIGNVIAYGFSSHTIVETKETTTANHISTRARSRMTGDGTTLNHAVLTLENTSASSKPAIRVMEAGAESADADQTTAWAVDFSSQALKAKRTADTQDRLRADFVNGRIYVGAGNVATTRYFGNVGTSMGFDGASLCFVTDNTYDIGLTSLKPRYVRAGTGVQVGTFATGSRPTAATAGAGTMVFDTTLGKPIWSDGTNWKDATGATV